MFGLVEQGGDLGKARAELIGDVAPGLSGGLAIGLDEDLPNCGRDCWLFGT
jgi:hypothetical protein